MSVRIAFLSLVLLLGVCVSGAPAQEVSPFLTPKIGTLGVGIDQGFILNDRFKMRVNVNGFRLFLRDQQISDVEYDLDINLLMLGPMLDYHPRGGAFRVTGGLFYNASSIDMDGTFTLEESLRIGPIDVSATLIGDLNGDAVYSPVTPYAGFGWGTGASPDDRWQFSLDLGVLYLGRADVNLRAPLAIVQPLTALVREEEKDVEDVLNRYRWYPVVMAGVSYRF